jgi:hypothetical protein
MIFADQEKKSVGRVLRLVGPGGVDRVRGGFSVDFKGVDNKRGFIQNCEPDHRNAISCRRARVIRLERRLSGRNENHTIERQIFQGLARKYQVPVMNRVECTPI